MQIVIKIPEAAYKTCVDLCSHFVIPDADDENLLANCLMDAIANGTVLPEHGRLIKADDLFSKVGDIKPKNQQQYDDIGMFMNMITTAPTILEATGVSE